jgi:general secretion pathway protein D
LQTSRPLSRDALLPTLENLLQMNGAALVEDDGLYRVVPREGALRNNLVPRTDSNRPGMNVRIVPLEYIAASEMLTILEPFLSSDAVVRTDSVRNILTLAGTRRQIDQWLETIEIFDVNWLEGMSVGLFTLGSANVSDVISELEELMGPDSESPVAGLFRFIPVERLNAVMAITPQEEYLEEARVWVERLDRGRDIQRERLHVYRLEHGKADHVASLLSQIFGGEASSQPAARDDSASLAPGMERVELGSTQSQEDDGDAGADRVESGDAPTAAVVGGNEDDTGALEGEVRILADEPNNALLIMASERDFRLVRNALRELDVAPRQVLVDASIVEVTLSDELRYGLQWFFGGAIGSYDAEGIFSSSNSANLSRQFPGFNYSLVDSAGQVRAVLSALAEDSRVNVLSSPSIMVLDNHSAVIRVGDQVPVRTSESTSTVTDNPVTVSNIQFRDTGVNLEVTPRVNSGGMVTMEVHQEVNDVSQTTTSGIDSPTIQQRLIQSSVAVQSGETIVLGGLIRESNDVTEIGVPGLRDIPLFGKLFGTSSERTRRTELLVLITPRVANNALEARAITADFRRHMRGIEATGRDLRRHEPLSEECGKNVTGVCEKNNANP